MERVTLYNLKSSTISINIVAYFNDKGDLKIDGYDSGSLVEQMKGSSDYEYLLTVEKENIEALVQVLDTELETLLSIIQKKFNDNYAFSNFKKFLKEHDIPFKQFYWS